MTHLPLEIAYSLLAVHIQKRPFNPIAKSWNDLSYYKALKAVPACLRQKETLHALVYFFQQRTPRCVPSSPEPQYWQSNSFNVQSGSGNWLQFWFWSSQQNISILHHNCLGAPLVFLFWWQYEDVQPLCLMPKRNKINPLRNSCWTQSGYVDCLPIRSPLLDSSNASSSVLMIGPFDAYGRSLDAAVGSGSGMRTEFNLPERLKRALRRLMRPFCLLPVFLLRLLFKQSFLIPGSVTSSGIEPMKRARSFALVLLTQGSLSCNRAGTETAKLGLLVSRGSIQPMMLLMSCLGAPILLPVVSSADVAPFCFTSYRLRSPYRQLLSRSGCHEMLD